MNDEMMREEMKVEVFSTRDVAKLQFQINKFFEENPDMELINVQYAHSCDHNGEEIFSALLVYK